MALGSRPEIAERREGEIDLLVPTYRVDVQRPCDVVEDVLRIYGYNNVEISTTVHSSFVPEFVECQVVGFSVDVMGY